MLVGNFLVFYFFIEGENIGKHIVSMISGVSLYKMDRLKLWTYRFFHSLAVQIYTLSEDSGCTFRLTFRRGTQKGVRMIKGEGNATGNDTEISLIVIVRRSGAAPSPPLAKTQRYVTNFPSRTTSAVVCCSSSCQRWVVLSYIHSMYMRNVLKELRFLE